MTEIPHKAHGTLKEQGPKYIREFNNRNTIRDDVAKTPRDAGIKSTGKTKGIRLNLAVSPMLTNRTHRAPSSVVGVVPNGNSNELVESAEEMDVSATSFQSISSSHPEDDLKYEVAIPSDEQLFQLDIEEQIRLLALKEMSIVEIKDSINSLNMKLRRNERDVHKLREVIQRSLYKELNHNNLAKHNRKDSHDSVAEQAMNNPRDEAIARTRTGRRRTLSSASSFELSPVHNSSNSINSSDNKKPVSNLWNNLTKPLNLIQQFDSMLSNEFDKKHTARNTDGTGLGGRLSEDSISEYGATSSPLQGKTRKAVLESHDHSNGSSLKNKVDSKSTSNEKDDVLFSVSSSLWTFMSDVKSNVLSTLSEEVPSNNLDSLVRNKTSNNESFYYNTDEPSTINLDSLAEDSREFLNNSDYEEEKK